jgi:hypothetical protein
LIALNGVPLMIPEVRRGVLPKQSLARPSVLLQVQDRVALLVMMPQGTDRRQGAML